ncbi:MAG: response regulator [Magnetospirillum sp.]|nr:response regulator [Magnetospirillum sp.]
MSGEVKVLFVDDDLNILSGLKRLMRGHPACVGQYCLGGEEALALMDDHPVDVVVSDMRMPGMDGAQFLAKVRERHPGTIRVILSGYADAESILRTVGPAHLYLAKPCDPATLLAAVARPLALRRLLASEGLRTALAGLIDLPTPPDLFFRLEQELRSPRASAASVAAIIGQDVAMTAELLKLTNSSYFAVSGRASTPLQAVRTLGMDIISALVLRIGIFRHLQSTCIQGAIMALLNDYSLRVAGLAERIAAAEGADTAVAKTAYCAGMLSSVGALVLLDTHPQTYPALFIQGSADQSAFAAETQAFGANHALVGAYLLGLWNFADPMVEAVAHACAPSACPVRDNLLLTAVHAARVYGPRFPLIPPRIAGPAGAGHGLYMRGPQGPAPRTLESHRRPICQGSGPCLNGCCSSTTIPTCCRACSGSCASSST